MGNELGKDLNIVTSYNMEDLTATLILKDLIATEEFTEGDYVLVGFLSRDVVNRKKEELRLSVLVLDDGTGEHIYVSTTSQLINRMLDDYNTYIGKFPVNITMSLVEAANGIAKRLTFKPN